MKANPAVRSGRRVFYGWYIVGAMFFMVFIGVGGRVGFGVTVDTWTREFGVSVAALSAVASAGWLANGLSQPLFGSLADRVGGRMVVTLSMVVMGLGVVAMGLSPSIWVMAFFYATVVSFAMGGTLFAPAVAVMVRWFRRKRGTAIAVLTAGASVGGMLLVPFMAYLLVLTSWRVTWITIGVIMILVAAPLLFLVVRNHPSEMGLEPDGDAAEVAEGASGARNPELVGPLAVEEWRDAYRSAPMWLLSFSYVVCGVTTATIAIHFVPYAIDQGISTSIAALAFGLLSFINLLGVLGVGVISDRIQRKTALTAIYAMRGVAFLLLTLIPGAIGLWVFAAVAGFSWLATVPTTSALTAELYGVKKTGTLTGVLSMVHQLAGAAAVLVAGITFSVFGTYAYAFAGMAVLLMLAAVATWLVNERACSARFQGVLTLPRQASEGA